MQRTSAKRGSEERRVAGPMTEECDRRNGSAGVAGEPAPRTAVEADDRLAPCAAKKIRTWRVRVSGPVPHSGPVAAISKSAPPRRAFARHRHRRCTLCTGSAGSPGSRRHSAVRSTGRRDRKFARRCVNGPPRSPSSPAQVGARVWGADLGFAARHKHIGASGTTRIRREPGCSRPRNRHRKTSFRR
jgi:hypothetical protein